MGQLDPGYLRHVYDELISGQIHPENPSDLPEGLIGLYEKAYDESISFYNASNILVKVKLQ
jgi:hypothetical protein